jgi:hypothetical protein
LGARHFVFLDNGSTDGTTDLIRQEQDTTLLQSTLRYRGYALHFKRHLVRLFGRNRWYLLADIDERFDFPGSGAVTLPQFCAYLDARGWNAVVAHMLDLFPRRPLLDGNDSNGELTTREHCFYDLSSVRWKPYGEVFGDANTIANPAIACARGGIRSAVFGGDLLLTKHPLARWSSPRDLPGGSHRVNGAAISDVSAVLYHYKFVGRLSARIDRAIRERSYYDGSIEYRRMAEAFRRNQALSLYGPTARQLFNVEELVVAGLLQVTPRYLQWVSELSGAVNPVQAKHRDGSY